MREAEIDKGRELREGKMPREKRLFLVECMDATVQERRDRREKEVEE